MFTAIAGFGVSSMAQETSAPKDKVAEITKTEKNLAIKKLRCALSVANQNLNANVMVKKKAVILRKNTLAIKF